ncbi:Ig-like domain-containing protein [Algibacter mikhailovii]|uniref:Ig-like domain-containing protein n=1 Tax=Algibacter mikhailovii TaxID=425498 RepID=UPI0024955E1D|nr:Ig-like domain-containing protein [Algibacter mikhailovii]
MKQTTKVKVSKMSRLKLTLAFCVILLTMVPLNAQVQLEEEIKITDFGLHFNGSKVSNSSSDNGNNESYDYVFGRNISAHGDCIKTYGDYVFMTWYRGGKTDRHVMLTRYNKITGAMVTIEFPHRHTGFQNKWWLGESHNTIGLGISPLDGTIHMIYDMHAYSSTRPSDGSLSEDYFRYSFSVKNAAEVSDAEFTLDKFVQNSSGGYKHLSLNGGEDYSNFSGLTYPKFFLNDGGDLFMYIREGGNNNGAYKFSKYTASTSTWSNFTSFNVLNAKNQAGITHNWGLYGNMKYVNGKIRIGYQRRSSNNDDKYQYQNGVYYAYSDNQEGTNGWKNHSGTPFSLPLYDADLIKVMEPGDYVQTTQQNQVYIVGDFDWTVTENGDVHMISKVKDNEFGVTKYLHTYKPAGSNDFITSEDFSGGASIYTSGDSVYIIGLNNGRVFVEKALGGTNNFTTVYQATSGKTFDHGVVYINNGKLYYYLMEQKTGSAQPLYLQIIDLDINDTPAPVFTAEVTSPANNANFNFGDTIELTANAATNTGAIERVNFRADGVFLKSDTTSPYSYSWTPSAIGTYNIDIVAIKDDGTRLISDSHAITVTAAAVPPSVSFSQPSGDIVLDEGYSLTSVVNASDVDGSVSNVKLYIDDILVRQENIAPYEWGLAGSSNSDELNGLSVGVHSLKAVATDNDGLTNETSITLTVNAVSTTIESVEAEQVPNMASNLLDGNTNDDSRWSAQGFSKSVVFDLGVSRQITGTRMWTYQNRAYQYRVESSNFPDSGFVTNADMTNNTSTGQPLTTSFSANARYVKLTITGAYNYSSNWVSITEFEVLTSSNAKGSTSKALSLNETENKSVNLGVFPNPAQSNFTIALNGLTKVDIIINDILGKIVYSNSTSASTIKINNDGRFKSGVYLIRVMSQGKSYHKKLIIK